MKKIISWVAGSFFRQAGRFLFFIVIGGLIFLLIQHNNIQFKWTDLLGIETVDALTYTTEVKTISSSYFDINNASDFTCATWDSCQFEITSSDSNPIGSKTIQISSNYNTKDKDFIGFYTLISQPVQIVATETYAESICQKWTQSGQTYTCSQLSGVTEYNTLLQNSILLGTNFQFKVEYTDNNNAYCDLDGNEIICPTFKKQIARLIISWNFKTHYTTYALFRFNKIANNIYYNSPTGAIESQTQQQQQQHNETISTITDTNTTSDSNSTATFFNETNTTSESALTSIVTAPVALINNLVVGSHDSICATLNNKQICLPSGDIIWNRGIGSGSSGGSHGGSGVHDNNHWFRGGTTEQFIIFFNLVVGGFILYKCLLSLFNSVHKLLDPANSWVGVMKL